MIRAYRFWSVAAAAVVLSWTPHEVAGQVVAGPTAASLPTRAGDRIELPVVVDMTNSGGELLGAFGLTFSWNPAVLSFVSTGPGAFGGVVFNPDSAAAGKIFFAGANAAGMAGQVDIGHITLSVVDESATSDITVAFSELAAAVTFTDLLTNLVTTSLKVCTGIFLGDVTNDATVEAGTINSADAAAILMHSVGRDIVGLGVVQSLADTLGGDVTRDQIVDTRDALVILSWAVQLDVAPFVVGAFLSGNCGAGIPATIAPAVTDLSLVVGDEFQQTVSVADATGNLLGGQNLSWSTSDTAVVTVDGEGKLTAVAAGNATVSVAAVPGVSTTTNVTVTTSRHAWIVDPATAQGNATELGSPAFPFSTIGVAIAAAAAGDTIRIAGGRYNEPLAATKALIFIGDESGNDTTVIATSEEPAGNVSGAGKFAFRSLHIVESQSGIEARADEIEIVDVELRSMRGVGIDIRSTARVYIDDVSLSGGTGRGGVTVDTATYVEMRNVSVNGVVSPDSIGAFFIGGVGIFIRADTGIVDSAVVRGIGGQGIRFANTGYASVSGSVVEYTEQSGIAFDSTAMAVVSGSRVFRSGTQGVRAEIVDSLLVRGTTIEEPGRNGVVALGYGLSDLDSVIVMRSGSHGFRGDSGGTAIVTNSEFHDVNFSVIWPEADTILVDNVLANGAGNFGVVTQLTNVVIVDNSEFSDMGVVGVGDFGTGSGYVSVTNSVFRNSRFNSIWVHSDSLLVQNDSMIGVPEGTAIVHEFPTNSVMLDSITFVSPTRPSWTIIRDNYIQDPAWQGVWTFDVSYVDIGNNTVTGANPNDPFTWALEVVLADSTMIDSNSVTNTYGGGIYTSESDFVYSRGNTVTNAFMGIGPFDEPRAVNVEAAVESHIVANTVVSDRGEGIFVGADTAVVDSNVARGIDSAIRIGDGPDSTGFWGSLTGNQIVGLGVPLIVSVSDTMSTAIVENNVIDSAGTFGLIVQAAMNSATIRGNTVSMRDSASSFAIGYSGGNVLVENNTFNCNGNRSGAIQIWGGGVWQNNVFNGCDSGTWSGPGNLATFPAQFDDTLVVTNNTFTTDTTLLGGVFGMGNNQQVADFTNNTMTGVPLVAIVGSTDPLFPTFLAQVGGNVISGSPTDAIFVADVDTALVRNNTVSGTLATSEVAVEVGSRIHTVVSNNSVTGALAGGVFVNGPSAAVVDSNVITDNVGTGLGFNTVVTAFKNTIRRNTTGIEDFWGGATVDSSNVDSNTVFGYRNNSGVNSNATNIWWGDALGPRCVTGCDTLSVGDSVSTFVTFTPFAAATVPGTPAGTAMPSARWLARRPDSSGQARRFEFPSFATPEIVAEVPAPRGFAARNMFSETVARLPAPAQLLQHRRRAER